MGGGVDDRYGVRGKVFDGIDKAEDFGAPALVADASRDGAVDDRPGSVANSDAVAKVGPLDW